MYENEFVVNCYTISSLLKKCSTPEYIKGYETRCIIVSEQYCTECGNSLQENGKDEMKNVMYLFYLFDIDWYIRVCPECGDHANIAECVEAIGFAYKN